MTSACTASTRPAISFVPSRRKSLRCPLIAACRPWRRTGEEGLQDVLIVEALYQSARAGRPVTIRPFKKTVRPTGRQRITRPGIKKPTLVKVQNASKD
jgi:hypothetical protein